MTNPTSPLAADVIAVASDHGVALSAAQKRLIGELFDGMATMPAANAKPVKKRQSRISMAGVAAKSIEGFGKGMDISGLTYGQFSLIDLIQATLDITGPADVTIATWSSGFYDIEAAKNFADDGRIRSIRFVMDSGRQKKGQAGVTDIAELFGEESIITVRTHAKFVIIKNDEWDVLITSSMNLNRNIRTEQFDMTDDPARCAVYEAFVNSAFEEAPVSRSFGRVMPGLRTVDPSLAVVAMPAVERNRGLIRMGSSIDLNRDAG